MKKLFFIFLIPTLLAAEALSLLPDISLAVQDSTLTFSNQQIELQFKRYSGEWTVFRTTNADNFITPHLALPGILVKDYPERNIDADFTGFSYQIDPQHQYVELVLHHQIAGNLTGASGFRLFSSQPTLERFATMTNHSNQKMKCSGFAFDLPGVSVGDPQHCMLNVPGPWFPKTYIGPNKPYVDLVDQRITFHGAPEAGFGFVGLTNTKLQASLNTWMDTRGAVNYHPAIIGDGERLTIRMTDNRHYWLQPNMTVQSDVQIIECSESLAEGMHSYRQMVEHTMPLGPAPDWVKEAVILEVYPPYFSEGFKGITTKLRFYKNIGFTCIYLMPHWLGGYSPINQFQVNPDYGTREDLQELVKTAHDLGLKVLFDMVIHGMNEKSPLMAERPELFCKNEEGEIVRHPTWRSKTFDWANPDYQQYMVDLVLHDLETYDIDGYRVDAASYKGPNWNPSLPYPAYRSGSAAPELMSKMLNALRSQKPDAVLLSEVFGPAFQNVCNFVHDNQTEACQMLIEKIDAGEATAQTYQRHLENVFSLLPAGANRVIYTRNHDTSWFYHFNGYTPRFLAFEAINALCGIPEIFTGDPNHAPNPDDDAATWQFYKKLFALRRQHPALIYGDLQPFAVESSNPMIFAAIKKAEHERCLVLVSLSEQPVETTLVIDSFRGAVLSDLNGHNIHLTEPRIKLQPFQVLVGQLQ